MIHYLEKDDLSYYSKKQFYERLKDCDIIKKGKKLNKKILLKYNI